MFVWLALVKTFGCSSAYETTLKDMIKIGGYLTETRPDRAKTRCIILEVNCLNHGIINSYKANICEKHAYVLISNTIPRHWSCMYRTTTKHNNVHTVGVIYGMPCRCIYYSNDSYGYFKDVLL